MPELLHLTRRTTRMRVSSDRFLQVPKAPGTGYNAAGGYRRTRGVSRPCARPLRGTAMQNACWVSAGKRYRLAVRLFMAALVGCLCLCSGRVVAGQGAEGEAKKPAAPVVPPEVLFFPDLTFC